jgi:hypothetical protein
MEHTVHQIDIKNSIHLPTNSKLEAQSSYSAEAYIPWVDVNKLVSNFNGLFWAHHPAKT